ncbi:hypothetical protein IF1G_04941 [Cordyceps javanica]|uniref:Uncharacterized protein n=1 Tax=Cordyceps javanica TaxID=43265 RepID=A0A545V3S5_9HYPO|nr:hypothetical protein IF1G_04941 [Cordyceps javanica]
MIAKAAVQCGPARFTDTRHRSATRSNSPNEMVAQRSDGLNRDAAAEVTTLPGLSRGSIELL